AAANPQRYPCLLESVASGGTQARFDVLFAFPQEALTLHRDGRVRDSDGVDRGANFLGALDAAWLAGRSTAETSDLPFHGGWAVFLGYELAGQIEPRLRLPLPPDDMPLALAVRCAAAIIVD